MGSCCSRSAREHRRDQQLAQTAALEAALAEKQAHYNKYHNRKVLKVGKKQEDSDDEEQNNMSSTVSSSLILDAYTSDPKGYLQRYRSALQTQRFAAVRTLSKRERGNLQGTLSLLYQAEEKIAKKALKDEQKKYLQARREHEQAFDDAKNAMSASSSSSSSSPPVVVAFTSAPAKTSAANAPAAALVAARGAEAVSLKPVPLSMECNVCYTEFNTTAPVDMEKDHPLCLRVHMTLCQHNSICTDCYLSYLTNRITSDDVLPFIPCPEAGCKLPLCAQDIYCDVPTPASVKEYEAAYLRADEARVLRNNAAWNAKHAGALQLDTTANGKKNTPHPKVKEKEKGKTSKLKKRLEARAASGGSGRGSRKSSTADDGEEDSDDDDDSSPEHHSSYVPVAPASSSDALPLLSTPLLMQLILQHMSKMLLRSKEWMPCGTHVKKEEEKVKAKEQEKKEEKDNDDAGFDLFGDDSSTTVTASSTVAATATSSTAPSAASSTSAPAAASTASSPPPSSAKLACPYGFLLIPPLYTPYSNKPAKLKKCDNCGLLQEVKPAADASAENGGPDDDIKQMVADGLLRPCPICSELQGKDFGMCNVLQCHKCSIWWNWSSRETGKNQAQLKDRARMNGTMWEDGELQYQQRLQREDLPAFIALLARNGIDYNPNYMRGSS